MEDEQIRSGEGKLKRMNFPAFDERLPFLNHFIRELMEAYREGALASWDDLNRVVKDFFTPEFMDEMDATVPGWKKMASYTDGITLTHVMCVFLGLFIMPEFQKLTSEGQQLAKWIVLFHDVEKIHIRGKRDYTHGFRSAVVAARALRTLGFPVNRGFENVLTAWSAFTNSATVFNHAIHEEIQDNAKLPEIVSGIEQMYGKDTPAALIVKGVLLHMSVNVVKDWPQAAPLTEAEIMLHVSADLVPLLKVMMLADNEGWVMFEPEVRALQRSETLEAFQFVERLIGTQTAKG